MASFHRAFRLLAFLALIATAAAIALAAGFSSLGSQLNQYATDVMFRWRGVDRAGVDRIAIVAIDDESLARYRTIPLDRALVAQAVRNICAGNPAALGLDLVFSGPSNPSSDQALADALRTCPQVVLAARLTEEDVTTLEAGGWSEPLPDFASLAAGIGHVHVEPDVDGVCRQVLLAKAAAQRRHWALSLEMLRVATRVDKILEPDARTLVVGPNIIPTEAEAATGPGGVRDQRSLAINYAGPDGTFARYGFIKVLEGQVPAGQFTGRLVLLGATAPAAGDRKFTPVSSFGRDMAGVEIHANALRTLVTGRFLTAIRNSTLLAILFAVIVAVALLLAFLRGALLAAGLAVVAAAVHVAPYVLFKTQQTVLPAFSLSIAFWMPLIVGGVFQYLTVWRRYREADATSRRLRGGLEMVAHEIRSPLTAIQGSGEVLSRYPMNDERQKQLGELVSRESQRVATLVARFLDVERLETGELELQRSPVGLRRVVACTVERVEALARRKNITLQFAPGREAATDGDGELLEFAVYNLLTNAIKYSPEGSTVEVRVGANRVLGSAFVEVKDQGPGLSGEEQARVFDKFFRTSSAQQSGTPGLGLGLSIVREIAVHHSGSVALQSAPGQGSRFSLTLPLLERPAGREATQGGPA